MTKLDKTISNIMDHMTVDVLQRVYEKYELAHIVEDGHVTHWEVDEAKEQ